MTKSGKSYPLFVFMIQNFFLVTMKLPFFKYLTRKKFFSN